MLSRPYSFKPHLGAQINRGHPLAQGLIGCWLFNEGGGLKAIDLAGNNHGGLTNGPLWVPGRNGPALSFDGSDDYVVKSTPSNLSVTGDKTVAIRLKVNDWTIVGGYNPRILIRTIDSNNCYQIDISDLNSVPAFAFLIKVAGTEYVGGRTDANYLAGTWYHVAFTFNSSSHAINTYVNGILLANNYSLSVFGTGNGDTLSFARRDDNHGYFNGLIGDVPIYNRILRSEEIQWLYTEPYAMFEQPRRGKWFFIGGGQSYQYSMVGGGLSGGEFSLARLIDFKANQGGLSGGEAGKKYTIDFKPTGGGIAAGELTQKRTVNISSVGGGISGGIVIPIRIVDIVQVGGGLSGGLASYTWIPAGGQYYEYTMVGGSVVGGSGLITKLSDFKAIGGGLVGGIVVPARIVVHKSIGGGISGGQTIQQKGVIWIPSGGAVANGSVAYLWIPIGGNLYQYIMSGGALAGGEAVKTKKQIIQMLGGGIVGGLANELWWISPYEGRFKTLYLMSRKNKPGIRIIELRRSKDRPKKSGL